jgi:hypothetical protein
MNADDRIKQLADDIVAATSDRNFHQPDFRDQVVRALEIARSIGRTEQTDSAPPLDELSRRLLNR